MLPDLGRDVGITHKAQSNNGIILKERKLREQHKKRTHKLWMAVLFLEDSGEDYGLLLAFFCDQSNGKNMSAEYRDVFVAFFIYIFLFWKMACFH